MLLRQVIWTMGRLTWIVEPGSWTEPGRLGRLWTWSTNPVSTAPLYIWVWLRGGRLGSATVIHGLNPFSCCDNIVFVLILIVNKTILAIYFCIWTEATCLICKIGQVPIWLSFICHNIFAINIFVIITFAIIHLT